MVQLLNESATADAPSVSKDNIVDRFVQANTKVLEFSICVAKAFKMCGISNALEGSENRLIRCVKEMPNFHIPYGESTEESDEDIFASTDGIQ